MRRLPPPARCAARGCRPLAPAPGHWVTLHVARRSRVTMPHQSGGHFGPCDDELAATPAHHGAPRYGSIEAYSRPVERCRRLGRRRPAQPPPPRAQAPSPLPTVHHACDKQRLDRSGRAVRPRETLEPRSTGSPPARRRSGSSGWHITSNCRRPRERELPRQAIAASHRLDASATRVRAGSSHSGHGPPPARRSLQR